MPTFTYKAKDSKGALIQGAMEADGRPMVVTRLQAMGLFPVLIEGGGSKAGAGKGRPGVLGKIEGMRGGKGGRIRTADMASFNRQMADLLGAGVPLVKALSILVSQAPNLRLREVLGEVNSDVQGGDTFAKALGKHPRVFSPLYIAMVRAGEAGGMLDGVLQRLADFSEQEENLKGKVKSALAYPIVMIVAGSGAIAIVLTVVVPRIIKIFAELNQALPLPTQMLLTLTTFLSNQWWLILLILFALVFGTWKYVRTDDGRRLWHKNQLRLPLFGPIIQKKEVARFARTLGSLLHNGVPILSALDIVREVAANVLVKDEVDVITDNVTQGAGVSRALKGSAIFPPTVVNMINVGEETGRLDAVLIKVADSYEMEVDRSVKTLTSLLEPIIILVMALVVGFIVISIMLPIFTLDPTQSGGG